MAPRPAPDLDVRREQITRAARRVAEAEGWEAVTMRRLAAELGVTQPVLYSAFAGRQALVDAVALAGFSAIADALEAAVERVGAQGLALRVAPGHRITRDDLVALGRGMVALELDRPWAAPSGLPAPGRAP